MNVAHLADTAATTTATAMPSKATDAAGSQDSPSFAQSLAQAGQQMDATTAHSKNSVAGSSQSDSSKKSNDAKKSQVSSLVDDAIATAQLAAPVFGVIPPTLPVTQLVSDEPTAAKGITAALTDAGSLVADASSSMAGQTDSAPQVASAPAAQATPAMTAQVLASLLNGVASAASSATSGPASSDQQLLAQIKGQLDKALQTTKAGQGATSGQPVATSTTTASGTATAPVTPVMSAVATAPSQASMAVQPQQGASLKGATKHGIDPVPSADATTASAGQVTASGNANASNQNSQGDGSSKQDHKDNVNADSTSSSSIDSSAQSSASDLAGFRAAMAHTGMPDVPVAIAPVMNTVDSTATALQTAAASVHSTQHEDGVTTVSGASAASGLPSLQSAKLLQTASQSEMRVGLQSQEFGNITIHTSAVGQTVSAQISVEHPELARELAARLPEAQTKFGISQNVEVRISDGQQFSAGTGSNSSSAGQDQQSYRQSQANNSNSAAFRSVSTDGTYSAAPVAHRVSNQLSVPTSGRIDIRA